MSASFEEKSVWIQLVGTVVALGAYFGVAANMYAAGVMALPAYAALFSVAVVFLVALLIAGFVVAALSSRRETRDERDRLIAWRAEHNSSWLLATGVFGAIVGMLFSLEPVWIAHLLLMSLFASEVLGFVLQLIYYRRGM
ncbi:MAG: hypothetical protein ACKVS9_08195 [Phycisphaerae bacterium]